MKTILTCAMMALCAQGAFAQGTYEVKGHLTGGNGKTIYLSRGYKQQPDSCTIVGDKFSIKGKLNKPYAHASISMDKKSFGDPSARPFEIILEPGTTEITGSALDLANASVKGGKTQTEKNEIDRETKQLMDQAMKLNEAYTKAQTPAQRDSIRTLLDPIGAKYQQLQTDFRKTHPDSYLSAEYLLFAMGHMNYEELTEAYNALSQQVRDTESGQKVKAELDVLAKVRPGKEAPLFSKPDVNGKIFSMKDLRGKVVIIDFWASWCVPCRKSNPHMLELYRKYHDRGLEMVYVADNDSSPDAWKKAIEKDGLTGEGFHHVLRGYKQGVDNNPDDVSNKYAIHYLPTKYLIDKHGNIVCKIDEKQEQLLDQKIEELLK